MDARRMIEEDIKKCIGIGLKQGVLVNPRISGDFFKDRQAISSKYTRFSDEADYLANYYLKYEQGEYFVALEDGSFFQINYEFSFHGKKSSYLKKMNLCYLPAVNEYGMTINEYLRIDYDGDTKNPFFHASAHVHIGFKNTIRIPLDEVLFFSEFLKLILYLYYQKGFIKLFGDEYKTTGTRVKGETGKLTQEKILTREIEQFFYLKTIPG